MFSSTSSSDPQPLQEAKGRSLEKDARHHHRSSRNGHFHRNHQHRPIQPGLFFIIARKVTISYGPYIVLGVMDYRTERLDGLRRVLERAGAKVKLQRSYHVNEVRVWHLERRIFSCHLTALFHGGDGELDPLCKAAGAAFEESSRRAYANLKHRYKVDECLLNTCPCNPHVHSNDSLTLPIKCHKPKKEELENTENAEVEKTVHLRDIITI